VGTIIRRGVLESVRTAKKVLSVLGDVSIVFSVYGPPFITIGERDSKLRFSRRGEREGDP
jgi:hypothetical protein